MPKVIYSKREVYSFEMIIKFSLFYRLSNKSKFGEVENRASSNDDVHYQDCCEK